MNPESGDGRSAATANTKGTSMRRLEGRVAAVTGSSSGHGRAIALRLAEEGAAVVCSDLRESALPGGYEEEIDVDTHDLIRREGGQAEFVKADVTNSEDMDAVVDRAVSTYGRLDIFVNNAGVSLGFSPIVEEPEETWDKQIDINLKGLWLGCKAAIRQMRDQERNGRARGRVVNIGSVAGDIGQADLGSYSAAKGGVHNLTRALAVECAPFEINVNAIAPGYFPTAMNRELLETPEGLARVKEIHPWPELGSAADVGAAVAFLASDDAGWITGVILPVDGGFLASK
jgi:NAD(P)-dependent dehydrogenase (short-subunit alcohol dehydrogenase family)